MMLGSQFVTAVSFDRFASSKEEVGQRLCPPYRR
jgi:hypothetical protein